MKKYNNLSRNIFLALLLGSIVGILLPSAAPYVSFLGLIFKLSLAMIVMPIVLTSILAGLESLGDVSKLSGLGIRTVAYFLSSTFIAIIIGLVIVSLVKPGVKKAPIEIEQIVLNTTDTTTTGLAKKVAMNVGQALHYDQTSPIYQDLENSLLTLAALGKNTDEIKEGALRLVGSLEIRSHLAGDNKPGREHAMTIAAFFTAQINKMLVNPFAALAGQNVVAVIVFSLLFGCAMTTIGPMGKKFFEVNRAVNMAIIKIVGLIMMFAPLGVFGLIVDVTASTGPEVFSKLGKYALCVLGGLLVHGLIVLPSINYIFGRVSPWQFYRALRSAMAVAFSTSSSNATLPVTMQCVEENLKIDKRIARFVLPLGATINMDGTALYEAVAAVFIAQLYGVSLSVESQILVAITAALASFGSAGIPAAGTVTMALVLSAVGLPIEGIGILLAIDRPLDMCRTVINVISDATGCLVINKYAPKNEALLNLETIAPKNELEPT